ncbi:MAG: ABC transporter permease [Chloroflexota bacterium]
MSVARHNLLKDKTRLALSIGGVALAVMLILLLNGFLAGIYRQITLYLDRSPGSILVAQRGVSNLLAVTSILPPGTAAAAEEIEGVAGVVPILSQFVILDLHGKKQPAYMVGYVPEKGGGPWQLASGRAPASDEEVVFDRVLAERHAMQLGDTVEVMGQEFIVVGLSEGTTSWMTSFFFIRKSAAESLLRAPEVTSFLLVTPAASAGPADVVTRLSQLPGVNALLKSEAAVNDLQVFARAFSAPLKLMTAIAFLVGTLVVGLVIYTATVEKQREYGVLKAIGASNGLLYRVVTAQALIAALLGVVAGVLLAYAASQWIMAVRPQFLVVIEPADAGRAIASGLGMALLAALFPVRVLAGLAPAEVFRR